VSSFPLAALDQFAAILAVSDFILTDKLESDPGRMVAFQAKIAQSGQGNRRFLLNYTSLAVNPARLGMPFDKIDTLHQRFAFSGIDPQYPAFFTGILSLHYLHKIALA
jgi:hypothetical protein